jgi:hypothetical protein
MGRGFEILGIGSWESGFRNLVRDITTDNGRLIHLSGMTENKEKK